MAFNNANALESQKRLVVSGYVDDVTGKKYTDVNAFLDDMEVVMATQAAEVAAEIMYEAEDYIAIANMIIFLYAMKMTVGNLKTVQKSYQKIIDNYNAATEYVDKVGIRKAYEQFRDEYGIEIEFEDFDINLPFEESEHVKRLALRMPDRTHKHIK